MNGYITCEICGDDKVHVIKHHLASAHQNMSLDQYRDKYPDAPLISETARKKVSEIQKAKRESGKDMTEKTMKPFHEVFGIPESAEGTLNKNGKPIPITVMADPVSELGKQLVPDVDDNYIFPVDALKEALMGLENNIPTYFFGHAGTGKSTLHEQIGARTNRPTFRVQHSGNTEEAHILGQYVVRDGATVWEPGPLQDAMKYGFTYLADEYDRAQPQVLPVYQPVLEGKPLVTKEAPPEWRIIKPHPDFRFVATGNTNGAGDELGLFPSTALQDFANYERFGVMIHLGWMQEAQEIAVVAGQAKIPRDDARQLVRFAQEVRKQVDAGQIGAPISPRALINAAKIGIRFRDYARGLQLAYIARLTSTDAEVCRQVAQRFFG